MMRYLPFIIISLALYGLFFYNNQQPKFLSANNTAQGKTVIPLGLDDVIKTDIQQLTVSDTEPVKLTIPSPTSRPVALSVSTQKKSGNIKKQSFYALIKSTPASDGALLKGEFYERDFYLHLPAPPKKKKTPPKIATNVKVAQSNTASSKQLKKTKRITVKKAKSQTTTQVSDKPKRSFKKSAKPQTLPMIQGLQEAIVVSGNKPQYPKKAKSDKLQGSINVRFIVNMQGKTQKPIILTSSGHKILDTAMLDFIKKERFMPALKGIEKVTSEQQFFFKFSLK